MKRYIAAVLLTVCTGAGMANTNDTLNNLGEEAVLQKALVSSQTVNGLQADSSQVQARYQTVIDGILKDARGGVVNKNQGQSVNGAVLFVSFSMPEPLLFALADQAASFEIPVVLNGLVDGDFKKTIETFKRLHKKAKKDHLNFKGVSIDPLWFEQFNISSVPALVVSARPANCEPQSLCVNQAFDVVYGNASLKNSLELIAEKGEAASLLAKAILENGHV